MRICKQSIKAIFGLVGILLLCIGDVNAQNSDAAGGQVRGVVKSINEAILTTDLRVPVLETPVRIGQEFQKGETLLRFDCGVQRAQADAASAAFTGAKARYDNQKEMSALDAAGHFDVMLAQAEMNEAKAHARAARTRIKDCDLKAPYNGKVAQLGINAHEIPTPDQPIMKIVGVDALAPVTVAPLEPFIVAAPFEGVVKEIVVDQGTWVEVDDTLIQFDDVKQRNESEIADRRAAVARARLQRVSQTAIYDANVKRELAVAQAEYDLALSEKNYADDIISKAQLNAPTDGLAVYTDKRYWVERPVQAGQTILQIANSDRIHFSIDLPVKESIVLQSGRLVKVFLDSDPLNPIEATLTQTSYQPRKDDNDVLSYRLFAFLDNVDAKEMPRIGVKGTAQVKGDKVPFIYAVLRRPLSSLRQITGF